MGAIGACVEELAEMADPAPAVSAATRAIRQARALQLDEVHAMINGGSFYTRGFRSPTDWLLVTTRESVGHCKQTITLADRIQHMATIKRVFASGDLAESSLRLLADAWDPAIADVFARDEEMLCGWATTLPHRDLKMVLDVWRMHADPDRESRTAADRFDARALHLSTLLDGVGRLDGTLDPESLALVREAIRLYARPADGETRTAAQRRADALVTIARMAIERFTPTPGERRRKPRIIATIEYSDLVQGGSGGTIDTDHDRIVVPAETIRRMACDCNVHRYVTNPLGTIVDYGRAQRVVTDSLYDTLTIRDHGCRWAGCAIPAGGCDAHHATHWLDNGETKPDNLILLCWYHHHLLHEQHWSIEPLGGGHFTLHDPRGSTQILRPPLVGLAMPTPSQLPLTGTH